jgi:hypothetical protein
MKAIVIGAAVLLPTLIAFGAVWKSKGDVQTLDASQRALEIEIANYRAAVEALIDQVGAQQPTGPPALASPTPAATQAQRPRAAAIESLLPAAAGGRTADTEASGRGALVKALAGLSRARASAEAAEAPLLAGRSYQAGLAVELEAQELATAGRTTDAMVRALEGDARFRAAEIEARAEATALERLDRVDAAPARPPDPADSSAELREPLQTSGPPSAPIDIEKTIHDVIAQYVNGLESRSVATLKRVWPSLGGNQERAIQTEFENARTVHTLFTDPRITVTGDITTVTGLRVYSLVTQDGQRLTSLTRTTMTLRRSGDAWVIERVVHQQ